MKRESRSMGVFLAAIAGTAVIYACGAIQPAVSGNPTPTKTPVVGAVELTSTSIPETSSNATQATPLLRGRYEAHSDVTVPDSKGGSVHTKIDTIADVAASAGPGNTLSGTAQIVYNKNYMIAGEFCKTSWDTGDVAWSEPLHGTYQKQANGSIVVSLMPESITGPGISEDYLCLGSVTEHPIFPGVTGTLVNNVYDLRQDLPAGGSNAIGTSYFTVHLELLRTP